MSDFKTQIQPYVDKCRSDGDLKNLVEFAWVSNQTGKDNLVTYASGFLKLKGDKFVSVASEKLDAQVDQVDQYLSNRQSQSKSDANPLVVYDDGPFTGKKDAIHLEIDIDDGKTTVTYRSRDNLQRTLVMRSTGAILHGVAEQFGWLISLGDTVREVAKAPLPG